MEFKENAHAKSLCVLVPPFAVEEGSKNPIPESLELATVYRLAERRRARSLLGLRKLEAIEFMVKAYYPLWAIQLDEHVVCLDPLGLHSTIIEGMEFTRVEEFIQHLESVHSNIDMLRNVLAMYQNAFANASVRRSKMVTGLVDGRMATRILDYLKGSRPGNSPPSDAFSLWKYVTIEDRERVLRHIEDARSEFTSELDRLNMAVSLLDREAQSCLDILHAKIGEIEREYAEQIEATRGMVELAIEELRRRRASEVDIVASRFTEARDVITADLAAFRKLLFSLMHEKDILERMTYNEKPSVDVKSVSLWRRLLKDLPKRLKEVEAETKKIQQVIAAIDEDRARQLKSIEEAYEDLIKAKKMALTDLEGEKELEIRRRREEIEDLTEKASSLRSELTASIRRLESEAAVQRWLLSNIDLPSSQVVLQLPFYLVCYSGLTGSKRFTACPPSIFNSSFATLTLGFGVLEERLKPFSEELREFFEARFVVKIREDPVLKREIYERGKPLDLLRSPKIRSKIMEGLEMVYNRGWLHFSSVMALKNSLKKHSSEPAKAS